MNKKFEMFSDKNTHINNMFFENNFDYYTLVFEINSDINMYDYYKDEQDISKYKNTEMSLLVKYSPFELPSNNLKLTLVIDTGEDLNITKIMSFCKREYEFFIDLCETYCISKFQKTAKEIINDELLDMNLTA